MSEAIQQRRRRIYVAGPYTHPDPESNLRAAIAVGSELVALGFAPLVTHLTHYLHAHEQQSWDVWMEVDLPWVEVADGVFRMPGKSRGADLEVEAALRLSIPVYVHLDGLKKYPPKRRNIA